MNIANLIFPFDYIVLIIIIITILFSFWKGFIQSILGLLTWVGSIFITIYTYDTFADFLTKQIIPDISLEGQIVRISDAVAYLNHDLGDAFRSGVLSPNEIPKEIIDILGNTHAKRINTLVNDLVLTNENISGFRNDVNSCKVQIQMSEAVKKAMNDLRDFMFERVYEPEDISEQGNAARRIVRVLYEYFQENPSKLSEQNNENGLTIVDFISGMTDYYAARLAERLNPGVTLGIEKGRGIDI